MYSRRFQVQEAGKLVEIAVGAIGDVATAATHRRRGIAAKVLADAHQHMNLTRSITLDQPSHIIVHDVKNRIAAGQYASSRVCETCLPMVLKALLHCSNHIYNLICVTHRYDLAVLHTSVADLAAYYAKLGYFAAPFRTLIFELIPGQMVVDSSTLVSTIVPKVAEEQSTIKEIAALHQHGIKSLTGCFVRTDEYWQRWVGNAVQFGILRVVRDASGTCIGYGVSRVADGPIFGGMLQVTEFFAVGLCDADRKACFIQYLHDELEAANPALNRIRVSPSTVNPEWLAPFTVAAKAPVSVGPVKEGGTLVCTGIGPYGSLIWSDEGQMVRPVGDRFATRDLGKSPGMFPRV